MFFDNIEANIGFKNLKPGLKFERKLLETRTKVPKHSSPSFLFFFFLLGFQIWKTFPLHKSQLLIISKIYSLVEISNQLRRAFQKLEAFSSTEFEFQPAWTEQQRRWSLRKKLNSFLRFLKSTEFITLFSQVPSASYLAFVSVEGTNSVTTNKKQHLRSLAKTKKATLQWKGTINNCTNSNLKKK